MGSREGAGVLRKRAPYGYGVALWRNIKKPSFLAGCGVWKSDSQVLIP
jgi:hypothetical protein